LEKQL
jgi:glycine C-acetyltransferase